jgi:hypothetical protein
MYGLCMKQSSVVLWISFSLNILRNNNQSTSWIWGSHSSNYEAFYLLGRNAMQSSKSQPMFLTWLTLQPWLWRQYVPSKHQLTFIRQHGITSQKIELFTINLLIYDLTLWTLYGLLSNEMWKNRKEDSSGCPAL